MRLLQLKFKRIIIFENKINQYKTFAYLAKKA